MGEAGALARTPERAAGLVPVSSLRRYRCPLPGR